MYLQKSPFDNQVIMSECGLPVRWKPGAPERTKQTVNPVYSPEGRGRGLNVVLSSCCLVLGLLFGAISCEIGTTASGASSDETRTPYYSMGSHFNPSDDLILTEFDRFGGPNIVNYPLCIYPESSGKEINDPAGVQSHMEEVVNGWLPYLYNRWGFDIFSVKFELKATTEGNCAEEYAGFRPFSVTSYEGGAFGGMAKRIRVRFPGNTINHFSDGKTHRQSILHEVGHVLGLMHTMDQSPISVMDYDDMHTFNGIGGDDIVGLTHAWKYLSEQIERGQCEFGYEGGPTCKPSGVSLRNKRIRNGLTVGCIQVNGTGTLSNAPCNGGSQQTFDIMAVPNGWQLQLANSNLCLSVQDTSASALSTQTCGRDAREQDFTLSPNSDNSYMLRSEQSGMVIQIDNGNLMQSPPDGGRNQTWFIEDPDAKCEQVDCCPADDSKTDPGICGCGVADVDTDGDGTMDCVDGCPDNPDKTESGICGCVQADDDNDSDGVANCNDGCPDDAKKVQPGTCGCGEDEPAPGESECPGSTTDEGEPDSTDDDEVDGTDDDEVDGTDDEEADGGETNTVQPSAGCTVSPISNDSWSCLWLLGLLLLGRSVRAAGR